LFKEKQREPLMELKLTTDRHPPITHPTTYPLRHAAPNLIRFSKQVYSKMTTVRWAARQLSQISCMSRFG